MKVLVVGSGGREHALVWKLKQSPKVNKIYAAPGSGGIAKDAECVDIKPDDINSLLEFAKKNKIDLTVVGPEAPLAAGIVDDFTKAGLKIFGPSGELAKLESSKVFAKETMKRLGVPTADFEIFDNPKKAKEYICQLPVVIKADGLAAGKGVIICKTKQEAEAAIDDIMVKRVFGPAGDKIVIEECLEGEEVSFLVVTDEKNVTPLASSQDHKRIFDNDKGPNTGGMGAYSPAPVVTDALHDLIMKDVIIKLITGLAKEGKFYKGVLYAGLMITKEGPKVLEFNVRFGDPETQAILPRMDFDLADLCLASIEGRINETKLKWKNKSAVCVVLASGGYPGEYKTGFEITGLQDVLWQGSGDTCIFHAGTRLRSLGDSEKCGSGGQAKIFETAGGRVLNVVSLGDNIRQAVDNVYKSVKKIKFEGMYYRKDIGHRALERYLEDTFLGTKAD